MTKKSHIIILTNLLILIASAQQVFANDFDWSVLRKIGGDTVVVDTSTTIGFPCYIMFNKANKESGMTLNTANTKRVEFSFDTRKLTYNNLNSENNSDKMGGSAINKKIYSSVVSFTPIAVGDGRVFKECDLQSNEEIYKNVFIHRLD